jgi:hypothetical protein
VIVLTSFCYSIGAPGSEAERARAAYAARARAAGVSVVDQLWFLDSVSRWKTEPLSVWEIDGTGVVRGVRKSGGGAGGVGDGGGSGKISAAPSR